MLSDTIAGKVIGWVMFTHFPLLTYCRLEIAHLTAIEYEQAHTTQGPIENGHRCCLGIQIGQ